MQLVLGSNPGPHPFSSRQQDPQCGLRHVPPAALGAPTPGHWRTAHWASPTRPHLGKPSNMERPAGCARGSTSAAPCSAQSTMPAGAPRSECAPRLEGSAVRWGGNGETPTGRSRTAQRPRDGGKRTAQRITENGGRAPERWSTPPPGMGRPPAPRGRSSTRDATHPRSRSHLARARPSPEC